ncbi:MAG: GMC oxidoreductase [Dongiaceae bacterium]
MPFIRTSQVEESYDLVVIGSGFGSLFFVHKTLLLNPKLRILMLERGEATPYEEQVAAGRNSPIAAESTFATPHEKIWNFTIGFGGGTNCWYGQTPRMHPHDFETRSRYDIGQDWPLSYDDLEPYYCEAEYVMQIAGPDDLAVMFPRSRPYPQPPHRLSTPDEIMKRAQPDHHFAMPTARARLATATRNPCCASARCSLCPVNAKFTAYNGFQHLIDHPSLSILTQAKVTHLDVEAGVVRRARFESAASRRTAGGALFVLGANAIHGPAILLSSGLGTPLTGVGINEQAGFQVEVLLDGVDGLDGGSITSGINYALVDGDFRRRHGGAMIMFDNRWTYGLRREFGRWRQTLPLVVTVENPPTDNSRVAIGNDDVPEVRYPALTDYALAGIDAARARLQHVLAPLPIEEIRFQGLRPTESHIQSSLRMGRTLQDSVVDPDQIHHRVRNLIVVGSSVFPSCPTANPSLTVAALALRAADRIVGRS